MRQNIYDYFIPWGKPQILREIQMNEINKTNKIKNQNKQTNKQINK